MTERQQKITRSAEVLEMVRKADRASDMAWLKAAGLLIVVMLMSWAALREVMPKFTFGLAALTFVYALIEVGIATFSGKMADHLYDVYVDLTDAERTHRSFGGSVEEADKTDSEN